MIVVALLHVALCLGVLLELNFTDSLHCAFYEVEIML